MTVTVDFDELELLLHDSDWVDAEFAAIMNASGFGDRVVVGVCDRPQRRLSRERAVRAASSPAPSESGEAVVHARVRSPPRR